MIGMARMPLKVGLGTLLVLLAGSAAAEDLKFADPAGDDFGPGTYEYPTSAEYTRGSFDLREVEIRDKGSKVEIRVSLGARIEDPWDSKSWPEPGNGFSIQMVQVYIDTDHKAGSGFTKTLPGLNAVFADADAWDKVVIISPQPASRLKSEVDMKAGDMKKGVVIPKKVVARGKKLIATVSKKALGGAPSASWGVQVVMQSNEGYPAKDEILTRKVNEFAGKHRFGGGNDYDCDPHVIDVLVAPAEGGDGEKQAQKDALKYECGAEGASVKRAVLPMVRR